MISNNMIKCWLVILILNGRAIEGVALRYMEGLEWEML